MTSKGNVGCDPHSPVSSLQSPIIDRKGNPPHLPGRIVRTLALDGSGHPSWGFDGMLIIYRTRQAMPTPSVMTIPSHLRDAIYSLPRLDSVVITCCLNGMLGLVASNLSIHHMSLRNVTSLNSKRSRVIAVHTIYF